MSGRKKDHGGGGGHGGQAWVISFADLMSLLMAFFVMLLSFSVQDQEKLNMAAGSVQNAFGIQPYSDMTGMIERLGNPKRDFLKTVSPEPMKASTEFSTKDRPQFENQGQEANTWTKQKTDIERQQAYGLAAASLKQAFQDLPDITAVSDHIIVEKTDEGTNIVIADQDGRAMFPEGSKYPFEMTRKAIAAMAPLLAKLPSRIRVSGYTAAGGTYDDWDGVEEARDVETAEEQALWREAYADTTQWIVDNATSCKIAYTAHTGDIIENDYYNPLATGANGQLLRPGLNEQVEKELAVSSELQGILDDGAYDRDGRPAGEAMRSILADAERYSTVR